MTLKDLLQEKKSAIAERWLEDTLATYNRDTAIFLRQNKDPFANPVGHALRKGIRAIFESLLEDKESDTIRDHLKEIIKIRAIQEFSPSQALLFVFLLKKSIRTELGQTASNDGLAAELISFETEIDRVALLAFDIFMQCREDVYNLRVNEVKRNVSAILGRFNGSDFISPMDPVGEKVESR
jgi:hypothetical protein